MNEIWYGIVLSRWLVYTNSASFGQQSGSGLPRRSQYLVVVVVPGLMLPGRPSGFCLPLMVGNNTGWIPWTWTCIYYGQNNQIYPRASKRTSSWNLFWIFRHANGMHIWKLLFYISCSGRYIVIAWLILSVMWIANTARYLSREKMKEAWLRKWHVKRAAVLDTCI